MPFLAWSPAQGPPAALPGARSPVAQGSAAAATLLGLLDAGHTHIAGTSHSACLAARAHATVPGRRLDCERTQPGLRIASKTGTPLWRVDAHFTHDAWVRHCQAPPSAHGSQKPGAAARAAHDARLTDCRLSPIKWWAAAIGDGQGWHKVVVAVAERNWQTDGWIDSRRDKGPNVAAEAGLAYVQGRWAGLPINTAQH